MIFQMQTAETTAFTGILICIMHWRDESLPAGSNSRWTPTSVDSVAIPHLALACQLECEIFEQDLVHREKTQEFVLLQSMRITVSSCMPLNRFPFDRQQLRIGITCRDFRLVSWHLENAPDDWFSRETSKSCLVSSDSRSFELVSVKPLEHFQNDDSSYTRMLFLLERVPYYYLWNYVFTTYLLVLLSVLVACVEHTAVADRASILLTLLLASVAQKFVSAQNLPVLDYQTLLDRHALISIFWLTAILLEVGMMTLESFRESSDEFFHVGAAVCWTLLHVALMIFAELGFVQIPWEKVSQQYHRASKEAEE